MSLWSSQLLVHGVDKWLLPAAVGRLLVGLLTLFLAVGEGSSLVPERNRGARRAGSAAIEFYKVVAGRGQSGRQSLVQPCFVRPDATS